MERIRAVESRVSEENTGKIEPNTPKNIRTPPLEMQQHQRQEQQQHHMQETIKALAHAQQQMQETVENLMLQTLQKIKSEEAIEHHNSEIQGKVEKLEQQHELQRQQKEETRN